MRHEHFTEIKVERHPRQPRQRDPWDLVIGGALLFFVFALLYLYASALRELEEKPKLLPPCVCEPYETGCREV